MSSFGFKEGIIKYGLLDNESNISSSIYFAKLNKGVKLYLTSSDYMVYGQINIEVKNPSSLKFLLDGIKIAEFNENSNKIISCAFTDNSCLEISGTSDNLSIGVTGARFTKNNLLKINNQNKYIARNCGSCEVCQFTDKNSILENSFTSIGTFDNVLDVQGIRVNDTNYFAYLTSTTSGVKLYTNINNYTNSILIDEDAIDARILPLVNSNAVIILLHKDTGLCYRKIVFGADTQETIKSISYNDSKLVVSLSELIYDSYTSGIYFGANFDDGSMSVFKLNGSNFTEIISQKANVSKILIGESTIEIFDIDGYSINITRYAIDTEMSKTMQTKSIYNANDIIKVGDSYLVFHNDLVSEVNIDNI